MCLSLLLIRVSRCNAQAYYRGVKVDHTALVLLNNLPGSVLLFPSDQDCRFLVVSGRTSAIPEIEIARLGWEIAGGCATEA